MKVTCDIIKDLLPLYYDKVCSEDTTKLVEEHLTECEGCRKELEYMSGEFTQSVEIEKETVVKSSSKAIRRIKREHLLIGILFSALIILGCVFANYKHQSQLGTTREKRQERLQEANHESVIIKDEYSIEADEKIIISIFDIYNGVQSGIAFFEKQENGSYQFKSSSWSPKDFVKLDFYDTYLFFFLDQPNISYAEVTIIPENGEKYTETYETTGLFWMERPELYSSYSVDVLYYNDKGELIEQR